MGACCNELVQSAVQRSACCRAVLECAPPAGLAACSVLCGCGLGLGHVRSAPVAGHVVRHSCCSSAGLGDGALLCATRVPSAGRCTQLVGAGCLPRNRGQHASAVGSRSGHHRCGGRMVCTSAPSCGASAGCVCLGCNGCGAFSQCRAQRSSTGLRLWRRICRRFLRTCTLGGCLEVVVIQRTRTCVVLERCVAGTSRMVAGARAAAHRAGGGACSRARGGSTCVQHGGVAWCSCTWSALCAGRSGARVARVGLAFRCCAASGATRVAGLVVCECGGVCAVDGRGQCDLARSRAGAPTRPSTPSRLDR